MQRALTLAARGKGRVSPNPLVGCVIVNKGKIVGEGAHEYFGGPHAEVMALRKAWKKARGGTVYINLEPCSHWGKTPPCAPTLIQTGIKQIFIASKDPNPLTSGKGIKAFKAAGIRVHIGLERDAAAYLNRTFFTWMRKERPHVTLKMAMTLDGKIASSQGDSKWISSPKSRRLVHRLRAESDAVLIGATTANQDNPHLTSHGQGRNPIRFILDPHLRTSPALNVYNDNRARTVILASTRVPEKRAALFLNKAVQLLRFNLKNGAFNINEVLKNIAEMDVSQLFIEGGGETAWSFLHAKAVDEAYFFIAPLIIGGRDSRSPVEGPGVASIKQALRIKSMSVGRIGQDILIKGSF